MTHTHTESRPLNLARLELEQNKLRFYPANCGQVLERRFSDHDRRILSSLTLLGEITEAVLLYVGRGLYEWLDGRSNWCAHLPVGTPESPAFLEISISAPQTPFAREESAIRFLEAPWELLADERGYLADHDVLCPYRRLGKGAAPDAPQKSRFSLLFMASSPESEGMPLLFEEEESAILQAVEHLALDLIVEESGDGEQLAASLARGVDLLHLSCHGVPTRSDGKSHTLLQLEDLYGDPKTVSPAEMARLLGTHRPTLFLSACTSAQSWASSNSYAWQMLDHGLPAVLGWSGKVSDSEATRFAAAFYSALSLGLDLPHALAEARTSLLTHARNQAAAGNRDSHHDWHLARLYLGQTGGGSLCTSQATAKNSGQILFKQDSQAAQKDVDKPLMVFLDEARVASPVAGPRAFVGRRRPLQQALRHFRNPGPPALLLHSLGRQGKSSLAHRIGQRLPDHRRVVIYGKKDEQNQPKEQERYSERAILEVLLVARSEWAEGEREHWVKEIAEIENRPGYWLILLQQLLGEDKWLLILDDLEQILEPTATEGKYHQAKTGNQPMLKGLLSLAASGSCPGLKLLLTSRYNFQIEAEGQPIPLAEIALPPMKAYESRKQLRARRLAQGLAAEAADKTASARESRCIVAGRGIPGLQDLLTRLALENGEVCDQALGQIEQYIATGVHPEEGQLQKFLNGLALESLLALLSKGERELLRISTLMEVPVPPEIYLSHAEASAGLRLQALGLWDRHEDICDQRRVAVAVHPLVRPRLDALAETEAKTLAALLAPALEQAWGGPERELRPSAAQIALAELALQGEQAVIVARATEWALFYLRQAIEPKRAGFLAEAAIRLCAAQQQALPLRLFIHISQSLFEVGGDLVLTERLVKHAVLTCEQSEREGKDLDKDDYGYALWMLGLLQERQGRLAEAMGSFQKDLKLSEETKNDQSRTVALGKIADIQMARGELEEALRIRREELLPAFERMGDVRSRAVTLGQIADIRRARGELEEALRILREEELPVYERLGNVRERAVTWGQIAGILMARGELEQALRILKEEELPVYEHLGDVRQQAMTMGRIADILMARGELEEALRIRKEEELPVYERLGDVRERVVTMSRIADTLMDSGELEEALRIRKEEELPVYERLGDVRSRAVTQGKIASILMARGELEEALRIRKEEELPVYERLGDVSLRAVTMGKIADILMIRGELEEALRIRIEEELPAYEHLGSVRDCALTHGKIADILMARGELEEALRIRKEKELPVYKNLGDVRLQAVSQGRIADILMVRGELKEALRIRQEEELPVYERLGDVRERAVSMGKVADILMARGELEEALRIREEEELPVFERLGNARERAMTMGKIADILMARGELEEALRIRKEEELPVFERLGDVRERAVTQCKIADILMDRGELEEALRILKEELLPVFERLGDVRSRAMTQGKIAGILMARGELKEALRIRKEEQLSVYERLGDVRSQAVTRGKIADILVLYGELDEALRIRQEQQLPVYQKLGEVREIAMTMGRIADILFLRGELDEAMRIRQEEELPVYQMLGDVSVIAETMGKIAQILVMRGELEEALRILQEQELPVYQKLGDVRSIAITMGKIADILVLRGRLNDALRIRQEQELPVYQKLGDVHAIVVTSGKIAQTFMKWGRLAEARQMQQECLKIHQDLGDLNGIAICFWDLAQMDLMERRFQSGFEHMGQAYALFLKLGQAEGLAVVGGIFGEFLCQQGAMDQGLSILARAQDAYRRLGQPAEADAVAAIITLFCPPAKARPGTDLTTLKADARKLHLPSSSLKPEIPGEAAEPTAHLIPFSASSKTRAVQVEENQDHGDTSAIIVPFRPSSK